VAGDFNDWFWPGSVRSALSRELPGHTRFRTYPSHGRCCDLMEFIADRTAQCSGPLPTARHAIFRIISGDRGRAGSAALKAGSLRGVTRAAAIRSLSPTARLKKLNVALHSH